MNAMDNNESIILFEDNLLNISEDHFANNDSTYTQSLANDTLMSNSSINDERESNISAADEGSQELASKLRSNEGLNYINTSFSYVEVKDDNKPVDDDDTTIGTPNDIQEMYKYVNSLYERTLANSKEIKRLTNMIAQLTSRFKIIEESHQTRMPELASRILLLETEQEKGESSLSKKEKDQIHKKINDNKTRIGNLGNFQSICDNLKNDANSTNLNFKECSEKIEHLKNMVEDIRKNFSKEVKGEIYREKFKPIDYSKATFNHEVILLVDSNLGKINPNILNHGSSCGKFFCPTLRHVDDLLNKVDIKSQPKNIFIHTGTNHFDEPDFDIEKLEVDNVETILKIKQLCPNAKIIISSLLPRKELRLKMTIASFNDFLLGVTNSTPKTQFMRNVNIKHYMLTDRKHVDVEGFKILMGNIRYTIFGKIPRSQKYEYEYEY